MLELIYPREDKCLICKSEIDSDFICPKCSRQLPRIDGESKIENVSFYSAVYYSSAMRNLVIDFKYRKNFECGEFFISLLEEKIKKENIEFDYISFVPSTRKVIKQRGFDHCLFLANGLKDKFNKPVLNLLKKKENVEEQKKLASSKRKRNVENAFIVSDRVKLDLNNKRILFIDDLSTTGATLESCQNTIKKVYKSEIILLTVVKSSI